MMQGKFITIEGLDGAGKSMAIEPIVSTIESAGFEVVKTREVGGTPIGEAIRELVLSKDSNILPITEVLLMFAARSQHLEQVIIPNLEVGRWVVCDRFTDSTYAYQGGGREIPFNQITTIENWTQGDFRPDLTLFFDADIDTARTRVQLKDSSDRFEDETVEFHRRVQSAFHRLMKLDSQRIKRIDAALGMDEVKRKSQQHINQFIARINGKTS